jgi:hypothetical protein
MSTATASSFTQTAHSLLVRPLRWLHEASDRRRTRALEEAFADAQLVLGERMFAAGIDDDETGEKIAAINARLSEQDLPGGDAQELRASRNLLFVRLADAALESDAPLPGADAEFEHALELKRQLEAILNGAHTPA